jgi:serine/threonine-protein kinase
MQAPTLTCLEIDLEPYPGYRLTRKLGSGGFGEVWEAETAAGTLVALKFLPANDSLCASYETRAIQLVSGLRHPNLVTVHDVWCFGGFLVVCMELAEGTLQDLYDVYQLEYRTPIEAGHLWLLLAQAASALDFLNARRHNVNGRRVGIQHCDVKPSNLLLFGDCVRVSDFSLAAATTAPLQPHRPGGTLAYVAPEVLQGRLSDRTDQYALAVSYCMLRGGRLPFDEPADGLGSGYVRPTPDLSMLPPVERPAIARALASVPAQRWRGCGQLISELRRVGATTAETPLPALHAATPEALEQERRASLRFPCSLRTSGRLLGESAHAVWEARIQNVSQTGIALISEHTFKRGTILAIRLDDGPSEIGESAYARVVRTTSRKEGGWLIGCTLARRLSESQVKALSGGSRKSSACPTGKHPDSSVAKRRP